MQDYMAAIVGTPDSVIEQMRAYAAAGAEEMMLAWWGLDDIEGLEMLTEHVTPYITA
jgi:alkanesulfonate monooxygenase SsuD/methylene tetrahydromethanopterin reductase-like flavin-dependent oxidoreductase (luciferase family)